MGSTHNSKHLCGSVVIPSQELTLSDVTAPSRARCRPSSSRAVPGGRDGSGNTELWGFNRMPTATAWHYLPPQAYTEGSFPHHPKEEPSPLPSASCGAVEEGSPRTGTQSPSPGRPTSAAPGRRRQSRPGPAPLSPARLGSRIPAILLASAGLLPLHAAGSRLAPCPSPLRRRL